MSAHKPILPDPTPAPPPAPVNPDPNFMTQQVDWLTIQLQGVAKILGMPSDYKLSRIAEWAQHIMDTRK